MRIKVCNSCMKNWEAGGHMCEYAKTAKPTIVEDNAEQFDLIRADIRELKMRLAPFLAMGPLPKSLEGPGAEKPELEGTGFQDPRVGDKPYVPVYPNPYKKQP